ncbi:MAG: MarR family winged helix-turn-helix transcriptional regulator [Actinomycetes bacterium]
MTRRPAPGTAADRRRDPPEGTQAHDKSDAPEDVVPRGDPGHGSPSTSQPPAAPRAADVTGSAFGEIVPGIIRERLPQLDRLALMLDMALYRAANALVLGSEAEVHRRYGWSWSGFRILFMLWLFEQAEARDLARLAGVSRQAASTVLSTLESKGLVRRERGTSVDRRLVAVRLTPEGQRLIEEAFLEQNRLDADWFGCLTREEQRSLHGMLERVAARIAAGARMARTAQSAQTAQTHPRADPGASAQ